jgi:predicted unusual protein kinase regulating ubiquinone biosynthesis (AarF/ABC1/UbiB family)
MGVIDFGAVAPMPGGIPVEIGLATRYALNDDYDNLQATMQEVGFIQKGEQVSKREMDDFMRQYVEPLEVEVFHYTRKWLQKTLNVNMDRSVAQIKAARQMDIPAKLVMPMRVIAFNVAIACQLDAHVPVRRLAAELVPGFAEEAA